ncbi:MAG: N-acetylmuramoyl-L-alanine amidase [Planctomycetes bacterium]|nr:N-acetylmuramoyl-L-alanine amidase [Planctomycetota bacterium]
MSRRASWLVLSILALVLVGGCSPGWPAMRVGDEIIVAGQMFHTGTRVVTYLEPRGYNAYRCYNHFDASKTMPSNPADKDNPNRYSPTRRDLADDVKAGVDEQGWTLENLRQQVDLFVIHYDVCGTSAQCFYVLHDARGLSVHFMLDLDGTVYQTLDLAERAWHAGTANDRSVGVEIAHWGAFTSADQAKEGYACDKSGWPYVTFPESFSRRELLTPSFTARPARKDIIEGAINGRVRYQYDFTNEQYAALIKLTATLHRVLPRIELAVPRGPDGRVIPDVLPDEQFKTFHGLVGHWHVIKEKQDPGPAFDWDRVLTGARWAI